MDTTSSTSSVLQELCDAARSAKDQAYCPYSNFRVGAALLSTSGKIYRGCNVENASYSLAICAERTAIVKAISEGERSFQMIAISSDIKDGFLTPCGSCRQALAEFCCDHDISVHLFSNENQIQTHRLKDLLPHNFEANDLGKTRINSNVTN